MASGLETKVEPFPETERVFGEVLDELRAADPKDLRAKLAIAGFLDHPYGPDKLRDRCCASRTGREPTPIAPPQRRPPPACTSRSGSPSWAIG